MRKKNANKSNQINMKVFKPTIVNIIKLLKIWQVMWKLNKNANIIKGTLK